MLRCTSSAFFSRIFLYVSFLFFTVLLIPVALFAEEIRRSESTKSCRSLVSRICYHAGSGTGVWRRPRHGVYRWPLRVQTTNAEIRPISFSRITSIRIIISILLSASTGGPGIYPGLSRFEAQVPRARTHTTTFIRKATERVGRSRKNRSESASIPNSLAFHALVHAARAQ